MAGGIAWDGWGAGPFRRAQAEGKLLFLLVSPRWCAGCRRFDETSLADPGVASLLAGSYVCVRVDPDRRPDLGDRYNQGSWPSISILMPDGRPLTGASALPADSLSALLERCAAFYAGDRERIDAWLLETEARRKAVPPFGESTAEDDDGPGEDLFPMVRTSVMSQVDPLNPGFFGEPKFLMPGALAFLRDGWLFEPDAEMGEAFLSILGRMIGSEVFDSVEGGFFRYAAKRDWTGPVREKLLVDNAGMLALCASAFELSGDPRFAEAGRDTLRFLLLTLYDRTTGAFFSSQEADAGYYARPAEERANHPRPPVDRTVVAEYNARALSALVAAARAFPAGGEGTPDDGLLQRAVRLGLYLDEGSRLGGGLPVRIRESGADGSALLADAVSTAVAFLDLHDATADPAWLDRSVALLERVSGELYRAEKGLFADRVPGGDDVGLLRHERHPFPWNAEAAAALVRCGRDAARPDLFRAGKRTLSRLGREFDERSGPLAAAFGSALLRYRRGKAGKTPLPGDPASSG